MKEYLQDIRQVMDAQNVTDDGLSAQEASERLERFGQNKLAEAKKESIIMRFLKSLADPMIIILLAAAAISAITSIVSGESFADVIIILIVVIINSILSVLQESKAEKAIEALAEMSAATSKVIRGGKQMTIHSSELVPGDVIVLEAGDAVPADARLIECASIKAEEAALTGESVPVNKTDAAISAPNEGDVPLGDRKNMVYTGSTIVYGRGRAVVTATGMDTEMGKIADAIATAQDGDTPLQKKLTQLSKTLSMLVLVICVVIFIVNIIRAGFTTGVNGTVLLNTLMVAVSLAVAAIPEGLAAVVTIVLSMGVTKMSARSAIIRKLTAVETLGCTQIICSDKTGTLTQNRMTVVQNYSDDAKMLGMAMSLCSDSEPDDTGRAATGDPTECALVDFAADMDMPKPVLKAEQPRIGEAPFDSLRKMMSTVHDMGGKIVQYTKGATDMMLERCTTYLENGEEKPMTEEKKAAIMKENKRMADEALRVLCAGYRKWDRKPDNFEPDYLEEDLCFVGLVGMIDPVRPEVVSAVSECRQAHIRPVMITGDHIDTATAIAKTLGIIENSDGAITGSQLDKMTDDELFENVEKYSVYARVQPEHKTRIVNAWRKKGMITAMTGDGVNDAPSIKSADIGVGMGITGTDVTKNVADMVLADDNFATIVSAVEEGRRIYDNIRKSIQFLLSSNLAEVLAIFFATLFGFTILKPVHLLWINLITDCFPALALGTEKAEKNIMRRAPRDSKEGIFSGGMLWDILIQGAIVTAITFTAFLIGRAHVTDGVDHGMTLAFLAMSLTETFHAFNLRSRRQSLFTIKNQNPILWGSMALSLVLTTAVIFIPFLRDAFGFAAIGFGEYIGIIGLAILIIPIVEVIKLIQRKLDK